MATVRRDPGFQRTVNRVVAGALNRTAFEILDAEKAHVASLFEFSGPSTREFLAGRGSFRFNKATPGRLRVRVFPGRKTGEILEDHRTGAVFTAQEGERLAFGSKLAIPVAVKRGRRGRVPKRLLPSEVVKPGRRGFVTRSGRAIVRRPARGGSPLEVLYVLVPRARVRPVFRFFDVARRTARREFGRKLRREWEKLAAGSSAR